MYQEDNLIAKPIVLENDWVVVGMCLQTDSKLSVEIKKKQLNGPGEYVALRKEDIEMLINLLKGLSKWEKYKELQKEINN